MTPCELCDKPATVQVTWASDKAPWTAAMCDACMREAWEKCQDIGSVAGWCMVPIAPYHQPPCPSSQPVVS